MQMQRVIIEDVLTADHHKQHIAHRVDVPQDVSRLRVRLSYSPTRPEGQPYGNFISLSLFDMHGSRGARHRPGRQDVTLSASSASPGFVRGPIYAGAWTVVLDVHRLLPVAPVMYRLEIDYEDMPQADRARYLPGQTTPRGPGWYRGDLHSHSLHSDGRWDVPDLIQSARSRGLDFITLTDHNTVSGLPHLHSLGEDDLLTIGGMELTTFHGHALAVGVQDWQEWRLHNGATMHDLAERVIGTGAAFIIAHPMRDGDPGCAGCDWQHADMTPGNAQAVEIWNSAWDGRSNNDHALQRYYYWLNLGHRLVATAGSDAHGPPEPNAKIGYNVVYAADLNQAAIVEAIKNGHLYVSSGPHVEISAYTQDGQRAIMGDLLPAEPVTLSVTWRGGDIGDTLRVIGDGRVRDEVIGGQQGTKSWAFTAGQIRWCAVEIRDPANALRAFTNPIFFGAHGVASTADG